MNDGTQTYLIVVEGGVEVEVAAAVVAIEPQVVLYPQGDTLVLVGERVGDILYNGLDGCAHLLFCSGSGE